MKKLNLIFALLATVLFSTALFSTHLSHAMEQEEPDSSGSEDVDFSSDSDSEITESDKSVSPAPPDASPVDNYKRALCECWTDWSKRNFNSSEGLSCLQKIIMLPKPADLSPTEDANRMLTYRTVKVLDKMHHNDACPDDTNPQTGNTALADFFINHHANNGYMQAAIESLVAYGASLEDITHDHRNFRDLIEEALAQGTLTEENYYSLLTSKTIPMVNHLRANLCDLLQKTPPTMTLEGEEYEDEYEEEAEKEYEEKEKEKEYEEEVEKKWQNYSSLDSASPQISSLHSSAALLSPTRKTWAFSMCIDRKKWPLYKIAEEQKEEI